MDDIYQFYVNPLDNNSITYGEESPLFFLLNHQYQTKADAFVKPALTSVIANQSELDGLVNDKYFAVKSKAPQGGMPNPRLYPNTQGLPNRLGMAPAVMPKSLKTFRF